MERAIGSISAAQITHGRLSAVPYIQRNPILIRCTMICAVLLERESVARSISEGSYQPSGPLSHSKCCRGGYLSLMAREFSNQPARMVNNVTEPRMITATLHGLPNTKRSCRRVMVVYIQTPAPT